MTLDSSLFELDPDLDLLLERRVDVSPELVWMAWTQPEHLTKWFTPAPWTTPECEIDLRPGGIFRTVMRSPEGTIMDNSGCYLVVVPNELLVWTDALLPGYRPAESAFMTGILHLERDGDGTRYRAIARHRDTDGRAQHEQMGFHTGWGTALDQLVAHVKSL